MPKFPPGLLLWLTLLFPTFLSAAPFGADCRPGSGDYVVLVHGLDWFRDTMQPTADYLNAQGYETINIRYPSRKITQSSEAADWVRKAIATHCRDRKKKVHLVAHSMGALVVRQVLASGKLPRLGRVVLLAAPNHGTPLADALQWKPLGKMVSPAAAAACCLKGNHRALPSAVDFAPGILMGNRAGWFPYFSPFLKGPDDGVVPVSSGRLEGMADFKVLATSHTRIPRNAKALQEVAAFLKTGRFAG